METVMQRAQYFYLFLLLSLLWPVLCASNTYYHHYYYYYVSVRARGCSKIGLPMTTVTARHILCVFDIFFPRNSTTLIRIITQNIIICIHWQRLFPMYTVHCCGTPAAKRVHRIHDVVLLQLLKTNRLPHDIIIYTYYIVHYVVHNNQRIRFVFQPNFFSPVSKRVREYGWFIIFWLYPFEPLSYNNNT